MSKNIEELKAIVGNQNCLYDKESLNNYALDWTRYYRPNAECVVFPKNTDEVQKVILWANENNKAIVPSGGRTGLSGGAVAKDGEIVLSLEKLNQIFEFNPIDRSVRCQAGVITENLQKFAEQNNSYFPVDFAARGSSHIGGNIATNAGGIKVLRYGLMRDWVKSLTVVTGKGEILNLNRSLIKNATGYDLRQIFIGSEGTLGIITEAEIGFTKPPQEQFVLVLAVPDLESVMKVYQSFKDASPLTAFEMFTEKALSYVMKSTGLERPIESEAPIYLLLEIEKEDESVESEALRCFEEALEKTWVIDGVISQNSQQAKNFWRYREDITESIAYATPYKNDISVRISKVPEFMSEIDSIYQKEYPEFEVIWFGHIGDGNLHISILKPEDMDMDSFLEKCRSADEILFQTIQKFEGSISAEHGVGLTKKRYLKYSRSAEEIRMMKDLKKLFDPNSILNPGKVFD